MSITLVQMSVSLLDRVIGFFVPPDIPFEEFNHMHVDHSADSPATRMRRKHHRWQWKVALTLMGLVMFAIFALSPYGFAFAQTVDQKIASKVEAAVKPLKDDIHDVKVKLDQQAAAQRQQTEAINNLLAKAIADRIINLTRRRCREVDTSERLRLTAEREQAQDEYLGYKGVRYPEPACADL